MRVTGARRKLIALGSLAVLAALAWFTMDPGKVRLLVMIILGGFAVRVALTMGRHDDAEVEEPHEGLQ